MWALLSIVSVLAAPAADKVTSIPGFESTFEAGMNFEVYSGFLNVSLADAGLEYDELRIHYEFHTCVADDCPVAVWHQGGPGGSAVYGSWTEMGPFQLMAQGPVLNLENAWNNVANMLYLESPAGSTIAGRSTGWSACFKAGTQQRTCSWNDVTQAAAYVRTLKAFFAAFPEYNDTDLYLVGESYAGQYIPNIAYYMINNPDVLGKSLAGIAVGNGCFGGTDSSVRCNGDHSEKNDIEIYHGKGLISQNLYDSIQASCDFSQVAEDDSPRAVRAAFGVDCAALLGEADEALGPYNIYNVYDNCNLMSAELAAKKTTASELKRALRSNMHLETSYAAGYPWNCESDPALNTYFARDDVLEALHLANYSGSGFSYSQSGPASVTLYPTIVKNMRTLIYNGDADLCVPYVGNEEWTTGMADDGYVTEKKAWSPWFLTDSKVAYAPSGYVTTYDVMNKTYTATGGDDFAFITIRLAGHMVPQYQPEAGLTFFGRFLAKEPF